MLRFRGNNVRRAAVEGWSRDATSADAKTAAAINSGPSLISLIDPRERRARVRARAHIISPDEPVLNVFMRLHTIITI